MGFLSNLFKNSSKEANEGKIGRTTKESADRKLSTVEKERIMVQRVTAKDMLQFPDIRYRLNASIHKHMAKNSHPFAYMDLDEFNQSIAKQDLSEVNRLIVEAKTYIPLLKSEFFIDISKIAFKQYAPGYGYTHLMCTPYTFTGKISKYPLKLSFMTRMDIRSYSAHGELFYGKSGRIEKGSVNIWREKAAFSGSTGWLFAFKTVSKDLALAEAKTTLRPDKYGQPTTVYKISEV